MLTSLTLSIRLFRIPIQREHQKQRENRKDIRMEHRGVAHPEVHQVMVWAVAQVVVAISAVTPVGTHPQVLRSAPTHRGLVLSHKALPIPNPQEQINLKQIHWEIVER